MQKRSMITMTTTALAVTAVAAALGAVAFATAAPTEADQCLAAKLKQVGKYEACRFKAESVAALKSISPDILKCETKFADGWQKTELKFGLDCPTNGDEVSIQTAAGDHVDVIVATLKNQTPTCGNSLKEAGEDCDGADLGGETCVSRGFDEGTLACSGTCSFDEQGCTVHQCELLEQTGCTAGQGCYPLNGNEICAAAGSSLEGESCQFANSCVPGLVCINVNFNNECAVLCDTIDNDPGCSIGQTCTSVPELGENIGVCLNP